MKRREKDDLEAAAIITGHPGLGLAIELLTDDEEE